MLVGSTVTAPGSLGLGVAVPSWCRGCNRFKKSVNVARDGQSSDPASSL